MNRKLYLIGTLAMVLLFASCKKEKETENNSFVISASIENDGSKTHVEGPFNPDAQHQNKYYKVKWDNNDKIIVFDQNGPGKNGVVFSCDAPDAEDAQWANFTCESSESIADNGSYWAFYPSATQGNDKVHLNEIVKNSNAFKFYMPSTQTYASGTFANNSFPMAAIYPSGSKSSVKLKFKHAFGVLKINAKGKAKITAIRVTDTDRNPLWGDFEFNLNTETTSACGDGYSNNHILTLNLGSGVQLSEQGNGTDFYIVLPPGTLQNFMVEFLDGSSDPVKSFTVSDNASTISRKTVTPATATDVTKVHSFSVSETKKVVFASGNLCSDIDGGNWRFQPNQWTQTVIEGDVRGMFYFSNEVNNNGGISWKGNGTVFKDWGNMLPSSLGTGWYLMTDEEWEYLLEGRTNAARKFRAATKVRGISGLVIVPDDWTGSISSSYDESSWANAESNGAVFLPRSDGGMYLVDGHGNPAAWPYSYGMYIFSESGWANSTIQGQYWMKTEHPTWWETNPVYHSTLFFNDHGSSTDDYTVRRSGQGGQDRLRAVRLARVVQ